MFVFDSKINIINSMRKDWHEDTVKNEPMLFNCSVSFAHANGDLITRTFLEACPDSWKGSDVVIDSRVHMLMPKWYPTIPGFHHDDVPRTRSDGQPNYLNPEYKSEHLTCVINAEICPTLFALGKHVMPDIQTGDIVYKRWHPCVVKQLDQNLLQPYEIKSGDLVEFDWQTMHTAQAARANGWRWFIRASRKTDRTKNITNEIRRQVNVYLEYPIEGW